MSEDPGTRKLLPQSSQMQSFSFVPNFSPRENQKNYVFVDEHNRHKRLKVMRACEGCRRRKIKCDSATTNTWPCSACIRLKLHCVPPTVNFDPTNSVLEGERVDYESGSGDEEYHNQIPLQQNFDGISKVPLPIYPQVSYAENINVYQPLPYTQEPPGQQTLQFNDIPGPGVMESHYVAHHAYPVAPIQQQHHSESPESYQTDSYVQQDLSDLLGVLKMDDNGSAPYLSRKNISGVAEEPAFEEPDDYKNALPLLTPAPDLRVRIPPELMPDEATCLHYFDMYFNNVHPYVPVLNKSLFYYQWNNNRESISPLILEAIFAIGGKMADDPSQGQQWLALAGKHADSFMDVPRLSTLQALLIILKARESTPKRGYYYRSWMTVVQCVAMGKDLGLDEHYLEHKAGRSCGSNLSDCITKTRIWQTIFCVELIIGSPQGRTDLSVSIESLDLSVQRPIPGEESEYHVSRNFTYFTRSVCNVRRMNNLYSRVGKKWSLDPEVHQLNSIVDLWLNELPSDLHISFPPDNSPPWLPSHFIGNLHSYHYLSIIMLHRPQLAFTEPSGIDGQWKQHMLICYNSAKYLCRIQEAILNLFGLPGMLCMQRGINYTIYCVLTCTVLHLVAITSPDPDLNSDARDFFTRHMRLLEKCTSSWPMPDMQAQIDALREAFSADTRKPFVLKPSFPYGSPSPSIPANSPQRLQYQQPQPHRSSPIDQHHIDQHHIDQHHIDQHHIDQHHIDQHHIDQHHIDQHHIDQHRVQPQVSYTSQPITPPISVGALDTKNDSPAAQSRVMMPSGQRVPQQPINTLVPLVDTSQWNPNRIFEQWNSTFGAPPSSNQPTSAPNPTPLRVPVSGVQQLPILQEVHTGANLSLPPSSQPIAQQQYSTAPIPTFVSPSMWQESVASVYEGGLKRHWDYDGVNMHNQSIKRR